VDSGVFGCRLRPNDRRRRRSDPQRAMLLTPLISVSCRRRRLVRGGRSGGGSVSNRVSITYCHLSPCNRSGSAGNGPLIMGFFLLLLHLYTE